MNVAGATIKIVRPLLLLCVCALLGCTQTTNLASSQKPDGGGGGDGDGDGDGDASMDAGRDASTPPLNVSDAGVVLCDGVPCPCNNGRDDDGDQLIDGFDPECTGPYDQDERTFATGEEPTGNPNCRDCFFDGNPSASDDGCFIAADCVYDSESGGPGACPGCTPSSMCKNSCLPRTPNGCDCFGCCDVQTADGPVSILLVDTCSLADLDDEGACPRCLRSTTCVNECGACEICPGRTLADLPSECNTGSGPGFVCEGGDACSPDLPCSGFAYCAQGCCVPILL